jgi:hypothetical protein
MVVREGPPIAKGSALGVEESSESVGIPVAPFGARPSVLAGPRAERGESSSRKLAQRQGCPLLEQHHHLLRLSGLSCN